jgi:hypothetical protein
VLSFEYRPIKDSSVDQCNDIRFQCMVHFGIQTQLKEEKRLNYRWSLCRRDSV